jgi:hypothetical protein
MIERNDITSGICFYIDDIYCNNIITFEESYYLKSHLKKQRPTLMSKFFYNIFYIQFGDPEDFWWYLTHAGFHQRVRFVKHLISKLK